MNAPTELTDLLKRGRQPGRFDLGPCPELVQVDPLHLVQRYSVVPARAASDHRLRGPHFHLLVILGVHCNVYGLAFPSQKRMAMLAGRSQPWVSCYLNELRRLGYVRFLKRKSKRRKGLVRRCQVLWTEGDPVPPWEKVEPLDVPWPLRDKALNERERMGSGIVFSTTAKETSKMAPRAMDLQEFLAYEKLLDSGQVPAAWAWKPDDGNLLRHQRYSEFQGRLDTYAWGLATFYADQRMKRWNVRTSPDISVTAARSWLRLGVDRKDALKHIDRVLDELKAAGKVAPDTLSKMPAPAVPQREPVAA